MRRFHAAEFVIHAAELFDLRSATGRDDRKRLDVDPVVKYAALSLFADRFSASLESFIGGNVKRHWLLSPIRDSNLQLFALISIWTSSKMNMSKPLSVKTLKFLGDKIITEQHFTLRDYFQAALNFEIGCASTAFTILKELFIQLTEVAKVGELINFHACMDIMDLLYEKEETSRQYLSPVALAASVLVCSYIITVPNQSWEFPILPWVKFATSCTEEYIQGLVKNILQHIFADLLTSGDQR